MTLAVMSVQSYMLSEHFRAPPNQSEKLFFGAHHTYNCAFRDVRVVVEFCNGHFRDQRAKLHFIEAFQPST